MTLPGASDAECSLEGFPALPFGVDALILRCTVHLPKVADPPVGCSPHAVRTLPCFLPPAWSLQGLLKPAVSSPEARGPCSDSGTSASSPPRSQRLTACRCEHSSGFPLLPAPPALLGSLVFPREPVRRSACPPASSVSPFGYGLS